jgi:hypothetical protein
MKILALEKEVPGKTAKDFQPHLAAEAKQVWYLQQKDLIREIYFRADEKNAVLILECENENEAQTALSTLPLVKAKLISFEVIPLVPYPGLERLFR